jgi:hypothetical protein
MLYLTQEATMKTRNLITTVIAACASVALLTLAVAPADASTPHAPSISSVSPSKGPTAGGTKITVEGKYLTGATEVSVDGVDATGIHVSSSTKLTAVTAENVAGAGTCT